MSDLAGPGSKYTDTDRRRAVAEYCATGNVSATSRAISIPRPTIHGWLKTDWWEQEVSEVKQQITEQICAQSMQIATKSGEAILDRIENGDSTMVRNPDYTKDEEVSEQNPLYIEIKTPVKAQALAVVGGIAVDKTISLSVPQSRPASDSDKIENLIKKFQAISQAHSDQLEKSVVSEQ